MSAPIRPAKAGAAKRVGEFRQIVTANRLSDGLVVFLAAGETWSEPVSEALVLTDPEAAEAALAVGRRGVAERLIVEPYAVDVSVGADGPVPTKLRERIRAFGPTARTDSIEPADARDAAVATA